ncbi:cbb3-type cytochrome oxidase subunit 3 [Sphingobium subterraneum]|uniref:Cytochrome c oxidase cbb3-type subunit 4 n=1 Tax=Sphingobium subterraneum TaxID=627688 RepID=A0A841J2C3_9SPHN|nr:cbb3-type cytochrome c oxidase subunit 3 [Sphingobium subterraneum]MBB6124854.1 cytochrome c oxidase cbb3-type subunit 4 [Sphingobium subterraneum]
MTYDTARHFADSLGLVVMAILFLGLVAWPFRKGARRRNEEAAHMIFKEDDHG